MQQDPIGDGMNWYAYAGNNPVVYIDPEGLHETTSTLHNMFHGDGSSWCAAKQGLAAWADGMIPFADPFAGYYNSSDPFLQASRTMGGVTRDAMISAGGAPNLPAWLKNPKAYEAGARTLPGDVFRSLEHYADDTATLGKELLSRYPNGIPRGNFAQYARTIPKGLTPPGYPALAGGIHAGDRAWSGHW